MQYQVPQFIEVEDKIFGPLTFKQFLYLAGGAGASVLFFTLLPLWPAVIVSLPFVALALALAFYTINDRPFIDVLEHAISYYISGKLYLWKQRSELPQTQAPVQAATTVPSAPKISESRLKELAWSLNIKDREALSGSSEQGQSKTSAEFRI